MTDDLKLLAVFAHPDDESMGIGGTLAKYSEEGVENYLICATRGEKGWFGPEEQSPGFDGLAQIRTDELLNAGKKLGLREVIFLDYIDGDLDQADFREVIGKLVINIRRIKPQVVVTFPPDGNYGHPDHIAIGQLTSAAIVCAADSSYQDMKSLPHHRVSKFYYSVDSENFVNLISSLMGDTEFPVDDQVRGEVAWKDWMVTTCIDVSQSWKSAWEAILCHKSQLASIGQLVDLPEESVRQVLCSQGTFYRAFSFVNGGRKTETDLFEGLR
jgi:LmbE family N-acetylglucosaminyl deacetylase